MKRPCVALAVLYLLAMSTAGGRIPVSRERWTVATAGQASRVLAFSTSSTIGQPSSPSSQLLRAPNAKRGRRARVSKATVPRRRTTHRGRRPRFRPTDLVYAARPTAFWTGNRDPPSDVGFR